MPEFNAAFWRWFGDSKIVAPDGMPMVVYHGTRGDYAALAISQGGEYGSGIYLTPDPNTAWMFAERARGDAGINIMPVYISMRHPFITHDRHEARGLGPRRIVGMGYDGIIGTSPAGEVQYVVFRPEQVKSAMGNDGTWDADDPNIASNPPEVDVGDRIGLDMDETITKYPERFRDLARRTLAAGGAVFIITYRSPNMRFMTEDQLAYFRIPYSGMYHVGGLGLEAGPAKRRVAEHVGLTDMYDDSLSVLEAMPVGVRRHLVR